MSRLFRILFASAILATFFAASDSARILGLFPTPSKSHLIIHSAIAEALAKRGHDVTVVSTLPVVDKNPPYRHILLNVSVKEFSNVINDPPPWYKRLNYITYAVNNYANDSLNQPQLKKLMEEESFDLVLQGYFLNEFLFGVAAHFKCPLVLSFMIRPVSSVNNLVGNPPELAYVPSVMGGGKQPLKFLDRVKNFLYVFFYENGIGEINAQWLQSNLYYKNFPSDKYPSFEEVKKNVSLVLTNHHFSQSPIRPDVPAVVEIGGIQIKDKPNPLPEDIRSIVDNATEHGVIYFSLGSNIQSHQLGEDKIKILYNVFSKLPQKVLWKWGGSSVPGNSPNIIFKNWLPQDDILPHPNVKLFVTHGGQGSVVESQFHGVPMVGIPMIADQISNMENVKTLGFGLPVEFSSLTEETFRKTIEEVLNNPKYSHSIRKFAHMYKDRPMTARQTAVFWIEYVLRHNGAPHMQSPAVHLNAFQLMSLDVIGFLLAMVYIVFKIFKLIYCVVRSLIQKQKKKLE